MKRYKWFVEWTRGLALFSAVFLAEMAMRWMEQNHIRPLLAAAILGLVAIVTLHVTELVAVHVVEHARWLKRWITADQWIEGMWFDEVVGENQFALVTINIVRGEIRVSGEQYDTQGNVTATWESSVTLLDGGTLRTVYRAPQFQNGQVSEVTGYSTYVFTGLPGKAPNFYSGSFMDASPDGRHCQLRGMRVTDALQIENLGDPQARKLHLPALIEQHRRTSSIQDPKTNVTTVDTQQRRMV